MKPYELPPGYSPEYNLAWSKAQKKLLEYLNSIYGTPAFMTASLMCIPINNWQSLLKDFGIS